MATLIRLFKNAQLKKNSKEIKTNEPVQSGYQAIDVF